jgi:hypothetical protein
MGLGGSFRPAQPLDRPHTEQRALRRSMSDDASAPSESEGHKRKGHAATAGINRTDATAHQAQASRSCFCWCRIVVGIV